MNIDTSPEALLKLATWLDGCDLKIFHAIADLLRAVAAEKEAQPDLLVIVTRLAGLSEGLANGNSSAEHAAALLAEDARAAIAKCEVQS